MNDNTDPKWSELAPPTHMLVNGIHYIKSASGAWAWVPDYSKPGTEAAVRKSVDEAYEAHRSIDRWKG